MDLVAVKKQAPANSTFLARFKGKTNVIPKNGIKALLVGNTLENAEMNIHFNEHSTPIFKRNSSRGKVSFNDMPLLEEMKSKSIERQLIKSKSIANSV